MHGARRREGDKEERGMEDFWRRIKGKISEGRMNEGTVEILKKDEMK